MTMKLISLRVELEKYGTNKGQYRGEAIFSGETGTVSLMLNEHHIEEMFKVCADSIIEVSKAAARMMTASVIEQRANAGLLNAD
jgi:hypothetical protein